jgi:hypothetical protein
LTAHRLFGIELHSDLDLPGASASARPAAAAVRVAPGPSVLPDPPESAGGAWRTRIDGRELIAAPAGGRLAIAWGDDCRFAFDPAQRELRWSAPDPADPAWQRLLLDTVAYLIALELGREALHAAAVVTEEGGAVAIAARSGMGKSTLTGATLAAGAMLLSDDIVVVEPAGAGVLAHPGPPLMNVPAGRELPGRDVIATLGDERWTLVPIAEGPRQLQALVLLERRPGAGEWLERLEPSPLPLLPWLLGFPRSRERERRRFEIAADLAAAVPLYRLVADTTVTPGALAERVLACANPALTAARGG